jgi:hypothetical protein
MSGNSKEWWQSRTVMAGAVATIGGLLGAVGVVVTPEQSNSWLEIIGAVMALIGGPGAIAFRLLAVVPIVPKAKREIERLKAQIEEARRQGFRSPDIDTTPKG